MIFSSFYSWQLQEEGVKLPAFDPGHLSTSLDISRHLDIHHCWVRHVWRVSMPRCLDVSSAPGLELSCSVEKGLAWPWAHPVWVTWGATWRHSPPNVACTMYNDYYGSLCHYICHYNLSKHIQTSVDCDSPCSWMQQLPVSAKGLQSCLNALSTPSIAYETTWTTEVSLQHWESGKGNHAYLQLDIRISTDILASLITLYISVLSGTAKIPMLCPTARNFAKDAAFCLPSSSEVKRQSQH